MYVSCTSLYSKRPEKQKSSLTLVLYFGTENPCFYVNVHTALNTNARIIYDELYCVYND